MWKVFLKEIVLCPLKKIPYIVHEYKGEVPTMVWHKVSSLKYPTIINLVFKKPDTTTLNDSMMHLKNTLKFGNYVWKFAKHCGIQCTWTMFLFLLVCEGFWWNMYVVFKMKEIKYVYQVIQS